jgi:uncharacterized protein (TIRG00374 family)
MHTNSSINNTSTPAPYPPSPISPRRSLWQKTWPVLARAGASALVLTLWLRFSSVDALQVFQALGQLGGRAVLVALAAGIGASAVAALKWLLLLHAQEVEIGFWRVWQMNYIAAFYGLVLPGTESGNAVKALLLGRISRRATGVWAAMLVDQLNLLLGDALIALVGVTFIAANAELPGRHAWIVGAALAVAGSLALHLIFLLPPLARLFQRLLRPISQLLRWRRLRRAEATPPGNQDAGWLARFWNGLAGYQRHLPTLGLTVLLSMLYQGLLVLAALQFALDLGISVSYANLAWVMTLVAISQALPITFAGIGVRDVALAYLLGGLGVPGASAIALSFAVLALNVALGLPGAVLQLFLPSTRNSEQTPAPAQKEP